MHLRFSCSYSSEAKILPYLEILTITLAEILNRFLIKFFLDFINRAEIRKLEVGSLLFP